MKNKFKFVSAVLVSFIVFGCGFLADKVEEKVSEEVDEQIKESQRKVDSILKSNDIDSLQKSMDSLLQELKVTDKQIDSLNESLDSKSAESK